MPYPQAEVSAGTDRSVAAGEAERRFEAVFQTALDAMFVYAADGTIVEVNPAACRMYGCAREDLVGVNAPEVLHHEARAHFEEFRRITLGGGEFRCQTVECRRDGTEFPIEVVGASFTYGGSPHLMAVVRDITERRRAEEQLRRSHDTFYNLIQNNPFGVYVVDADFKLRQVSLGSQKVFASVPPPLLGRDFAEVLRHVWAEPFATEAIAIFRRTLATGEPYVAMRTVEERQGTGEVQAYDWRIDRVALPDGRWGVVCYFYDFTEQQRLEAAVRANERRLRSLVEQSAAGIAQTDLTGRIVFANDRYCQIVGYAREEVLRLRVHDLTHADDLAQTARLVAEGATTGAEYAMEKRYVRKDGSCVWVAVSASILKDEAGRPESIMGVVVDISDRKRAEESLREMADRLARQSRLFERIASTTPDFIYVFDLAGRFIYANRRLLEVWGRTFEDAVGKNLYELGYPAWHADMHVRELRQVAQTRRPVKGVVPYTGASGIAGVYEYIFTPVLGPDGAVEVIAGTTRDITERGELQREREELLARERAARAAAEAARAEAERASEAKSEFLATLSHELRTPLTPVLLTASLLESDRRLPEALRDDVAMIRRNVELESRLISDLLDLTRIERGKLQLDEQDVDLHLIVRSAVDICQREASAALAIDLAARRHHVRGDATRLQQVFWNLVNNAIKFAGPDGRIAVRSADAPGGRVRVEVVDTGVGFDPSLRPRLFTAFEQGESRAARQQAGLGLGLAISKRLVEMHGGTIDAHSEGRGLGATFSVELPTTGPVTVPPISRPPRRPAAVAPLRVLLVEDNEPTLKVLTRLLREMGHRVTAATTAAGATAAAGRERFDLIISDLGLPDGSGLDVMRQLRDRYAGRAIALTGYGMESDVCASQEAGFAEHLTKPVDVASLEAAIGRVAAAAGLVETSHGA